VNNAIDLDFLQGHATQLPSTPGAGPSANSTTEAATRPVQAPATLISTGAPQGPGAMDPRTPVVPGTKSLRQTGVSPNSYVCEMDAVEYHNESPGISYSRMKHMLVSPAMYQLKLQRPMQETDALRVGRMLHTTVLEPHLVNSEFAIWRDGRRQGGEWDLFRLTCGNKTIITEPQMACVEGMSEALMNMADFPLDVWLSGVKGQNGGADIAPALKEHSLFWVDEETGLQCKARPDAMTLAMNALVGDLKSARSAAVDQFVFDIFKFRYDMQAAHYLAGVKAVYGIDARFAFFAVEKEEPHVAQTFLMSPDALAHGERHRRYCLRMIKRCLYDGSWPKQPPGAKPVLVEVPFMRDNSLNDMAEAYGVPL